jgi:endonuclease YncB( thermonuclease family)
MRRLFILLIAFIITASITGTITANTLVIEKVHSGDIVEFRGGFTARLTGIRSPGLEDSLGQIVYQYTKNQLAGKLVTVFTYTLDNSAAGIVKDDDGYPFVQIEYGDKERVEFNIILLQKGYARIDEKYLPPFLEHYKKLEEEARVNKLGIWNVEIPDEK